MLFNSYPFIFGFLPLTLFLYFRLARTSRHAAAVWLTGASIFFYAWWNPAYVGLLLASITFNFLFGARLLRTDDAAIAGRRKSILLVGITGNLALLAYYKYADFAQNLVGLSADAASSTLLPLGISFFTFTQIAFLVDAYRGQADVRSLTHYTLFVSYFPHLIAGPILHHKEIMPQFEQPSTYRFRYKNIATGLTIFAIGLFKKTVLADGIATYATPLFDAAANGTAVSFLDAWGGALAYTLQLYFDFSGYSDMAIGISLLFGIRLPLNFNSPYKASNIIDFWHRWHMTLSRFLRDYLYIPLGGNRKGKARRYLNLMLTMLIGGLWHGAGWTFILWGGLHGIYLIINHTWRALVASIRLPFSLPVRLTRFLSVALTFTAVVLAWVVFRSPTPDAAWIILQGMAGMNGIVFPASWLGKMGIAGEWLAGGGIHFGNTGIFRGKIELIWIAALLAMVWILPNTQQFMARQSRRSKATLAWNPGWRWAAVTGVLLAAAILNISRTSEFLYFQF